MAGAAAATGSVLVPHLLGALAERGHEVRYPPEPTVFTRAAADALVDESCRMLEGLYFTIVLHGVRVLTGYVNPLRRGRYLNGRVTTSSRRPAWSGISKKPREPAHARKSGRSTGWGQSALDRAVEERHHALVNLLAQSAHWPGEHRLKRITSHYKSGRWAKPQYSVPRASAAGSPIGSQSRARRLCKRRLEYMRRRLRMLRVPDPPPRGEHREVLPSPDEQSPFDQVLPKTLTVDGLLVPALRITLSSSLSFKAAALARAFFRFRSSQRSTNVSSALGAIESNCRFRAISLSNRIRPHARMPCMIHKRPRVVRDGDACTPSRKPAASPRG